MKTNRVVLLVLTLVALSGLAIAQSKTVVKATVPFDFVANGQTMPAGECEIRAENNGIATLQVRSGNRGVFVIPNATESLKASEKTVLVFHRYGDRYFLSAIKRQGETSGYSVPAGKLENEMRAQYKAEAGVTLVAAK